MILNSRYNCTTVRTCWVNDSCCCWCFYYSDPMVQGRTVHGQRVKQVEQLEQLESKTQLHIGRARSFRRYIAPLVTATLSMWYGCELRNELSLHIVNMKAPSQVNLDSVPAWKKWQSHSVQIWVVRLIYVCVIVWIPRGVEVSLPLLFERPLAH